MKKKNKFEDINFFEVEDNRNFSSGITAPHTLTPEEVLGEKDSKEIISDSHNALEALKKRMTLSHQKLKKESRIEECFSISSEDNTEKKQPPKEFFSTSVNINSDSLTESNNTKEKIAENADVSTKKENTPIKDKEAISPQTNKESDIPPIKPEKTKSLLDRCSAFLVEEDGSKANTEKAPLYKLQSVADILKSDGEKFIEKLSEDYDVWFDDLKITPESVIK